MEVDKAIKDCDDRRLKTKYNNAIYVIRRALALYDIKEVVFSFNGGKDSTVLLHLLRAGYYLHQLEQGQSNVDLSDHEFTLPIRTLYFETTSTFPEINSFTYETAASYGVKLDILHEDFKSGLEALLKAKPIRAIFLGVRIGDPTAVGQEQFSPSSPGWPPFMRVNPILDWSYSPKFIKLLQQGRVGFSFDLQDSLLWSLRSRIGESSRARKLPAVSNGLKCVEPHQNNILTASIIAVGDEILFGTIDDQVGPSLCRKLHSIGWVVSQIAIIRSEIDSVSEEVERRKSMSVLGVGPLHSDITVGGVAKAFGVRLAPDEEYEEYLSHLFGDKCTRDRNEMAQLLKGITELLQHKKFYVPLIKCHNVIVLTATNVDELEQQWDALIELRSTNLLASTGPFVEVAQPLSKISFDFPDIYTGCYRKSRMGPLIITLKGKDQETVEAAMGALSKKLSSGVKQISV